MSLSVRIYDAFAERDVPDYGEIDALKKVLDGLYPITDDEAMGIGSFEEAFEVRFVYNSNSMEGSTLTPGETALVLEGEFVPGKPGREYFAARGSADGMAYYRRAIEEGRELSEGLIKDIHERTALDCQPAVRGRYRQHPVYIRGSRTVPANFAEVPLLMKDLIGACHASKQHEVYKAVVFHVMFEATHPFSDGNGRTGRLVLNYMLESAGYPPVSIKFDAKADYIAALEAWQVLGDSSLLPPLVAASLEGELKERISCITQTREAAHDFEAALDRAEENAKMQTDANRPQRFDRDRSDR